MKSFFYTTFALVAFAFNSILCRLALQSVEIDAASFTAVRLISGALTLLIINSLTAKKAAAAQGSWLSAFFLFAYAICFSFAYTSLTTATGALVLFGCVQATMIFAALVRGERPSILEWLGLLSALGGLIYLVFPGLAAPPPFSSFLMVIAGMSWGFYTLRGKKSIDPLADTTGNFLRSVPMIFIAALPFLMQMHASAKGVILAIVSGAVASGLGYSVWYAALRYHTATRAAILQLSVPILAAIGGVIFLSEKISIRLLLAALMILGGIAAAVSRRKHSKSKLK